MAMSAGSDAATDVESAGPGHPFGRLRGLHRDERVAFMGVGAFNTLLGATFFVALELTLGRVVGYMVVLLIAHVLSVLCAFVLHRRLVFRVTGNVLVDLVRFETVYLGGLAINAILLPVLVEIAQLPVILSQFLIVSVTALVSFFGHKHFSFRRSPRTT
jgi:putative flippase GtrA